MVNFSYLRIIKLLDNILLSKGSNFTTHSISDLNFVKGHNFFLKKYNLIKYDYFYIRFIFYFIKNITIFIIYFSFKILNSIFYNNHKIKRKHFKILFVSHYVEKNKSKDNDFYFSNLSKLLDNINIKSAFVYFKHKKINKINYDLNSNFFFFKYSISFKNLFIIFSNIFKEFYRLLFIFLYSKKSKQKKIILFSLLNLFKISTIKNQIVSFEFEKYILNFEPSLVILTFEGHPFERLFFNIANKNNIKSLGYVSSVFLPFQYGNNRSLKENFNPTYIGYQSEIIKNLSNPKIKTTKLIIGNNKLYKKINNLSLDYSNINILLLPEGLIEEENFFILQCIKFANKLKNYNFYIRLHPLSDFKSIKNRLGINNKLPKNIILSSKNFEEDLKRCNFAIYRGSSAIIYACNNYLIPIYLNKNNSIYINPLFELKSSIFHINTSEQLYKAINYYINHNESKFEINKINNYCDKYFEDFKLNNISSILD